MQDWSQRWSAPEVVLSVTPSAVVGQIPHGAQEMLKFSLAHIYACCGSSKAFTEHNRSVPKSNFFFLQGFLFLFIYEISDMLI